VLEERPHRETARATETSVALQLTVEEARGLLADNTDLVQGLFRWMLDHPAFVTGRLVVRGSADGADRGTPPAADAAAPAVAAAGALRPIDVVLALRRIPLFARSSVEARLALAAIAREERLATDGVLLHASDAPAIRLVIDGALEATTVTGETVAIAPNDTIGVLETCAGVPLGANVRVTVAGRALRISHEDFFDLLGQRADLLRSIFVTLFGARRAEWGLAGEDTAEAAAARELV
jgi:CRP-like cAMP-binding protein